MLFIGMGTEVFVFFLSAFDRPFDKTAIGMDLPTHFDDEKEGENDELNESEGPQAEAQPAATPQPTVIVAGQPVVAVGQPYMGEAQPQGGEPHVAAEPTQSVGGAGQSQPATVIAGGVAQSSWIGQQAETTPEMAEAQNSYVEQLNKLVETLGKVNEQSERLTRDSEEMENLNRTLTGITKIYEMQLKGASQQVGTIDQINEQTRKMAQQIDQLNKIYARMIEAMTVNMRAATPGAEKV